MARTTKEKNARESVKSESAEKRKPQIKKTKASKGKGAKPVPAAERSKATKGCGKTTKKTASTSQRSQTSRSTPGANAQSQQAAPTTKLKERNVGKVYRGRTKYIDQETKLERNYVVVVDDGKKVSVAKLKSIKIFDENGKNADKALVEINATRYGLEKRTGVDFQVFDKNRMSGKPLNLEDKEVFPEDKERFKLGSHDLSRTLRHTGRAGNKKKKGK